jgi:pimeloyl-ACP methyl ester carboxylesterase
MMSEPIEEMLPRVAVPTMLVAGEKDPIVPQRWFHEAARLVRAEQVAVISGWGHAVNYSAPDELAAAIMPFLARP